MENNEITETYKMLSKYVMEQSSAADYISNYMETILKHISIRLCEDNQILCYREEVYYQGPNTFDSYEEWEEHCKEICRQARSEL